MLDKKLDHQDKDCEVGTPGHGGQQVPSLLHSEAL